jgi:hypothetical protein
LYLSPHHDDVCFSIGHIARQQGGDLINLFTRSEYAVAPIPLPTERLARIEAVSRIRRDEDVRYCQACGLSRHDLQLSEPSLFGIGSRDSRDLEDEIASLSTRLLAFLEKRLSAVNDSGAIALYCPMGIGGHRNHLSTLMTIRKNIDLIQRTCTVFLYEDLHYASDPAIRKAGIKRAKTIFKGRRLNRFVTRLPWAAVQQKMEDVGIYLSQHLHPPEITKYIPASNVAPVVHESIWKVGTS